MASPIERSLLKAIIDTFSRSSLCLSVDRQRAKVVRVRGTQRIEVVDDDGRPIAPCENEWCGGDDGDLILFTSPFVERYELDMLLFCYSSEPTVAFAIECDGHEWHERTKQQASYDRARDRRLASIGIVTLRFTGSDIYRDSNQCANEIIEIVSEAVDYSGSVSQGIFCRGLDSGMNRLRPRPEPGASAGLI